MEHGYEDNLNELSELISSCNALATEIGETPCNFEKMEPKEQAQAQIIKMYGLNTLFSAYLRAKNLLEGMALRKNSQRIRDAMIRLKSGEDSRR